MTIEGITSHYMENSTRYHAATEAQVEKVINAAFDIIGRIGMEVSDPQALELLEGAGCQIEGTRVHVPQAVIADAIGKAPNSIEIFDRNGKHAMDVGGTNVYFGSGPTNPFVNDFETGERRQARVSDVANSTKVIDACEELSFVMNLADPSDCPAVINDVYSMREMLENTTKPIMCLAVNEKSLAEQYQMAVAVAGSEEKFQEKPFVLSLCGDPVSPLYLPDDASQKLVFCIRHGIPVVCPSGLQMGTTGPVSIASSLALGLAEQFLILVLSQAAQAGGKFIICASALTVDMTTMAGCYATPEHCLIESLLADVAHYLDLPMLSTNGSSDSKIVDGQLIMENSFTIFTSAMSGAQLTHDIGFVDSALTTDLDAITISNDIIKFARRICKGIGFDDDDFVIDVIEGVGPSGNFLTEDHTLDNYMDVTRFDLFEHRAFQNWAADGKKTFIDRAHEKSAKILAEHVPEQLSDDVKAQLDAIVEQARTRVGAAE